MAKWINDPKKLVVITQRMENYGDAENPNWKIQDGETYVVKDIFEDFEPKVETFFLPKVKELVEYSNDSRKEYIISYRLEEEDVEVCDPGLAPIELRITGTDDLDKNVYWGWAAHRLTENTNGYMRTDIQAKQEHWTPLPGGVKKDYLVKHWDWDGEDIFDLCSRTKLVLPA